MAGKPDSELEQQVLRELSLSKKICSPEICVLARDGVIRLRGSAQSYQEKLAVTQATRRATGVLGVVNEMKVKPSTALIPRVSPGAVLAEAFRQGGISHRIATEESVAGMPMR